MCIWLHVNCTSTTMNKIKYLNSPCNMLSESDHKPIQNLRHYFITKVQLDNPRYSPYSKVYFIILQNKTLPQICTSMDIQIMWKHASQIQGRCLKCRELHWNKIGVFCSKYFVGLGKFGCYYTKKQHPFTVKLGIKQTLWFTFTKLFVRNQI